MIRPRIYISYPYIFDVEKRIDYVARKLKQDNFRVYIPLGIEEENKIWEANLKAMENCQGMIARVKKEYTTSWAYGVFREVVTMSDVLKKPTIIWTDDIILLKYHPFVRTNPNLYSVKTLKSGIELLKELFQEQKSI